MLFLNDFSQRILEKRAENIPRMLEERKKGNVEFLHMDKLIVYGNRKRNRNSDDCDNNHKYEDCSITYLNLKEKQKHIDVVSGLRAM